MIGDELAPGLWRWTAFHEEWGEEVGSVAMRRGDELVLVDPLLSDQQLERLAPPPGTDLHVVLTIHYHARSSADLLGRLPNARVWAHAPDAGWVRRRTPVTDVFRPGDSLPGGLEAHVARPRTEVVLWDPTARALIPGDTLLGAEGGGLRMCPRGWLPQSATIEQLRSKLLELVELEPGMVLVSHGEPVLEGAGAALGRALR